MSHIVVMTTTDNRLLAEQLARESVRRKLAACVQIVGPITSIYRWQDELEDAQEFRCEMKTSSDHFDALQSMICELHTYDVPEIIAVPLTDASVDYARWLDEQLNDS